MVSKFMFFTLVTLPLLNSEYIPPGPVYPCPKESDRQLIYPCVCENGSDEGLYIKCENTGLAVLSVGLGNLAGLEVPVERLLLKECKISHLFGPLLHRSTIRVINIEDTPIKSLDMYVFAGVNRTLQELYMGNTEINEFPKEAFKILGNLSILSINGHKMEKLSKDIFAESEAAGRLEKLYLPNGLISDIPVEAFQNLKKLKVLDLHGNKLANLKKNQFKGLRDTEVLDISYNNITKLDGSHIGDLAKLGWCNVSHNQISDIPRGMFARNALLKVLHLDNNKLKKIDTNSFKGMRFLRRLYLQDNQISEVGRGTFSSVTRIGTVDLARNRLMKVDYQMFQQVKYAEMVNLAENNIKTIESQAFTDLYQAVLNISYNELTTIDANAFQNCNNLTVLDLSHNRLSEINKKAFDENCYAFELQVSYNEFVDFGQIPIANMTGIRILNASHNSLSEIPRMAFPKLYELHTVDLSYNNLTEIFNAVFQNLFSLRFLNLSHNSMEVIKPATFGTLPTLLELDLSHNQLRDPSRGGFAKMASCRLLDVSHNHLDRIFQIPISLAELNFAHNSLLEIPPNTWPSMNALLRLNLSSNMLGDSLGSHSYAGLLTLQSLDLSHNSMSRPPWEALNTLSSLQYLYLQNNNLTALSKASFGNLPTMFQLDLSHNLLVDIARESFKGMQQLLHLSLRGNQLESIPNEAFKGLVALRKLDLSYNKLEKIDNKTNGLLDDCLSLDMVNLSHNNFGFLTKKMFPSSPWIPYRLTEVDLSHNGIPVLTLDVTQGLGKLKRLHLAGNVISDIRNNVLGNLTSLEMLDLSNNNIRDLVSKTSNIKLNLPKNITSLYLQNNILETLPVDNIVRADKLTTLDVRYNQLNNFDPRLVRKINNGLDVYFDGNILKCDCFVRPLRHYLNHLAKSIFITNKVYSNITCAEPAGLRGENVLTLDEDRLLCNGNTEADGKMAEYGNTGDAAFDFVSEPDLAFRYVLYAHTAFYVQWYVLSNEDVADFVVYIRDDHNKPRHSTDVAYNLRSVTIAIDDDLQTSLKNGGNFDICVSSKSSDAGPRRWHSSQCQSVPKDFDSWPKELSADRRRNTKKRTQKRWFSNNVLGLVSDSILITLCIFLGVFIKLNDFE